MLMLEASLTTTAAVASSALPQSGKRIPVPAGEAA